MIELGDELSGAISEHQSKTITLENDILRRLVDTLREENGVLSSESERKEATVVAYKLYADSIGEFVWCGACTSQIVELTIKDCTKSRD